MRILHIAPTYFPVLGGAELHLQKLSEGLASRGHQVTVLTANVRSVWDLWPGICGGLPKTEVIESVQVQRFRPDGGPLGFVLGAWQRLPGGYRSSSLVFGKDGAGWLSEKPRLVQVIPYLLGAHTDIVTSANWYWPPAYHAYLARKLKRFTLVGIPLFHTAEAWCHRPIYPRMLAACDAVVANTAHEAGFIQERAVTRVDVAGVGIDPGAFECRNGAAIRARYTLGTLPVVGFVGRQAANKGTTVLLQAMKAVWKWNPEVRLVFAGSRANPDPEVERLVAGFAEFEKKRIVRIEDFPEEEKASIYDAFDVFVLPSVGESFGISYLEAWMCSKPVIGARIGPTQCVIDEGNDGLLVDPSDPQDIARAMIRLLSDGAERQRMGQGGRAKTLAQFTWDKVTDKVEKLYLELVAQKAGRRDRM